MCGHVRSSLVFLKRIDTLILNILSYCCHYCWYKLRSRPARTHFLVELWAHKGHLLQAQYYQWYWFSHSSTVRYLLPRRARNIPDAIQYLPPKRLVTRRVWYYNTIQCYLKWALGANTGACVLARARPVPTRPAVVHLPASTFCALFV